LKNCEIVVLLLLHGGRGRTRNQVLMKMGNSIPVKDRLRLAWGDHRPIATASNQQCSTAQVAYNNEQHRWFFHASV